MCWRTEEEVESAVGLLRHRNFVEFLNVAVQAPTWGHPFYTVIPRKPSISVTFFSTRMGIRRTYFHLKPQVTTGHRSQKLEHMHLFWEEESVHTLLACYIRRKCSVETSQFCVVRWIGCLSSQLTIFQSYMWRNIDVQADWRSWTYGRAPNAIDIS